MSNIINTDNVKRNSKDFSFVDSLGSFIQNYDFSRGYDEFRQVSSTNKYSYIWEVLSAIGGNYAETIYENVLNYIDNVSNIDLCKVKDLQSIIEMLGIDYNIVNDVQSMPIEIVNMIDILSINKHYLLNHDSLSNIFYSEVSSYSLNTFASTFYHELSSIDEGKCFLSAPEYELSNDLSGKIISNKGGEEYVEYDVQLSNYNVISSYLDNDQYYRLFLVKLFKQILDKYVYLKYADAENSISTTETYIYEYIKDKLTEKNNQVNVHLDVYEQQINNIKTKYKLEKFDQSRIVDDIENGNDYIERYNQYQQEVLSAEITKRKSTYPYDKAYTEYENVEGYNITRYSYYRERKVIEYFSFIENTYSSLINSSGDTDLHQILNGTSDTKITVYDKDENYFDIQQSQKTNLLYYDQYSKQNLINVKYINAIAELLAQQTLELADIREQIKIQMRKSYLKGTFLLLSYIINEYLKYDISKNYGNIVFTEDNIPLSVFIDNYISNDCTELIEYYDITQYYNISSEVDLSVVHEGKQLSILNFNQNDLYPKFYDCDESKVGINTQDIPLEEIDYFYREQLKMKLNQVHTSSDLTNFLSLIYDYGANNSFLADRSDVLSSNFRLSGEFYCQAWNEQLSTKVWLGDISAGIELYNYRVDLTDKFIDEVKSDIAKGYSMSALNSVSAQLYDLSNFISSNLIKEISAQNDPNKDIVEAEIEEHQKQINDTSDKLDEIWKKYEELSTNVKYSTYLSSYDESAEYRSKWMIERINRFENSVNIATRETNCNGIIFRNTELCSTIYNLSVEYADLENKLSDLIENYVKEEGYWEYYNTQRGIEITSQTQNLVSYLQSQATQIQAALLQHLQNHLDALNIYKEEVVGMIDTFVNVSAMYENFEQTIGSATGTDVTRYYGWGGTYFTGNTMNVVVIGYNTQGVQQRQPDIANEYDSMDESINSVQGINASDHVTVKLEKLKKRCELWLPTGAVQATSYYQRYREDAVGSAWNYQDPFGWHIVESKLKEDPLLKQDWLNFFSPEITSAIVTNLDKLVVDIQKVASGANIELDCLQGGDTPQGSYQWHIDIGSDITQDNVGEKLLLLFDGLLARIKKLDGEYIQKNQLVKEDKYIYGENGKLERIKWIIKNEPSKKTEPTDRNPSTSKWTTPVWNVKRIDNKFNEINIAYEDIKNKHQSPYLEEYPNTVKITLKEQFKDLFDWMREYDLNNKKDIQDKISEIKSEYQLLLDEFKFYLKEICRYVVSSVDDSKNYVMERILYSSEHTIDNINFLDKLLIDAKNWLNGKNNKSEIQSEEDKGILRRFEESAFKAICAKIEHLKEYQDKIDLFNQIVALLGDRIYEKDTILYSPLETSAIGKFKKYLEDYIKFIQSKEDFYNIQKEIYLKYNGTSVGYDPFYNFKNKTHSSYQIHPYLYNFVEKSNLTYPLANTFFIAFSENYEQELVMKGLDNIIGKFGNVINLSKYSMFDWTGYQSQYEKDFSNAIYNDNLNTVPDQYGFTGLFYPKALNEFLDDPVNFVQNVQDNLSSSYYYRLGLSQEELKKIVQQLKAYEKPIREIAQRVKTQADMHNSLSTEYDIYKYTQDVYGNSLMLLKSYKDLYERNSSVSGYVPSYNEKKDTPGELWMRIKNHPIAFPAFDLRAENEGITQYETNDKEYDEKKLNSYIRDANDFFSDQYNYKDQALFELTKDSIQLTSKKANSHLRCFFDMELSYDKQTLLLATPFQTGTHFKDKRICHNRKTFTYGNSNIILGYIYQDYNYTENKSYHTFSAITIKANVEGVINNIDNIKPDKDLRSALDSEHEVPRTTVNEFIGFTRYSNYTIAAYVNLYWMDLEERYVKSFVNPTHKNSKPYLSLQFWCYNGNSRKKVSANYELKYDILYKNSDNIDQLPKSSDSYRMANRIKYANKGYEYSNRIAIASTGEMITLGFATEEVQYKIDLRNSSIYSDDTTIVNFAEYTRTVENRTDLSVYGQNKKYPSDTALLQTTDSQHINIYNSFDSFTSYLVNVDLKFVGSKIAIKDVRYYNLNTDIGYYPMFADRHGMTRFNVNSALSGSESYNLQLLGPENSDVDYTPVIQDTNISDQYGRVTEDYRDYNKKIAYTPELTVNEYEIIEYTFELPSMFVDALGRSTFYDIAETGDLIKYKWNLVNTSYPSVPVSRGKLSEKYPTDYYYASESKYDLLSGQEIFGPNGVTYQGIKNSNHIDNISAILTEVKYNEDDIPTAITMSCLIDGRLQDPSGLVIPENKFQLLVYVKNTLNSYQYYRIIENAQSGVILDKTGYDDPIIHKYEDEEIEFSKISSLSEYSINGRYPFKDVKYPDGYDEKKKNYRELSAMLEFKYSEEETIDREYPALNNSAIEDEVIYMLNEEQYIYFFSLDCFDTINKEIFYMEKYDTSFSEPMYRRIKVNTISRKYQEFYDKSLTIETTYNVENISEDKDKTEYGLVLYFNYKNYTNPQYVQFKKRYTIDGKADVPEAIISPSTSKDLNNTYLRLLPGKSGQLDIRIDYVEYAKINQTDIGQSIVGKETKIIKTYYIMNVSDNKPKFIVSRKPFKI